MRNVIDNILRPLLLPDREEINVVYFPYDGVFEQSLISNRYKFYTMVQHQIYPSSTKIYPSNFFMVEDGVLSYLTPLDLVIANHRKEQIAAAQNFAHTYHLPLLLIDHELPAKEASDKLRKFVSKQFDQDGKTICFDSLVTSEWCLDISPICNYSSQILSNIDENIFTEKTNNFCLVGDYSIGDMYLVEQIVKRNSEIVLLNQYKDFNQILQLLYQSKIVVSIIEEPRPPLMALYSMSVGCIPCINRTRWTDSWELEKYCIVYDTIEQMHNKLSQIIKDEEEMFEKSRLCIQYVNNRFNTKQFKDKFNSYIESSINQAYTRK